MMVDRNSIELEVDLQKYPNELINHYFNQLPVNLEILPIWVLKSPEYQWSIEISEILSHQILPFYYHLCCLNHHLSYGFPMGFMVKSPFFLWFPPVSWLKSRKKLRLESPHPSAHSSPPRPPKWPGPEKISWNLPCKIYMAKIDIDLIHGNWNMSEKNIPVSDSYPLVN